MEAMAERWTDDRLDDLKVQVEGIDRRMEQGFSDLRGEIHDLRDHMDKRLDAMLYALIGLSASMFAAMLGLIAVVIVSL